MLSSKVVLLLLAFSLLHLTSLANTVMDERNNEPAEENEVQDADNVASGGLRRRRLVVRSVCPTGGGQYATIHAALAAANNGDILDLCAATFTEAIDIGTGTAFGLTSITIRGKGKLKTTIRAPAGTRYIVNARVGTHVTIKSLTLDGNNQMAISNPPQLGTAAFACDECSNGQALFVRMINLGSQASNAHEYPAGFGVIAMDRNTANGSGSMTVKNCDIVRPPAGGVWIDGPAMVGNVRFNSIEGDGQVEFPVNGIQVSRQARATVSSNTVVNYKSINRGLYWSAGIATVCAGTTTSIQSNTVTGNDVGVSLLSTESALVSSNTCASNRVGVLLELQQGDRTWCPSNNRVRYNNVRLNTISGSLEDGLKSMRSYPGTFKDNTIENNSFSNNGFCHVRVKTGNSDDYQYNTMTSTPGSGIIIQGGSGSQFISNTISQSSQYGIRIMAGGHSVQGNTVSGSGIADYGQ